MGGATVAAPAYPVRCTPGDNLAVHVAVTQAPAGSVLVVDVGDVPDRGYWGEVLTTGALARGLAGLVIDGGRARRGRAGTAGFPGVLRHRRPSGRHQGRPRGGRVGHRRWPASPVGPGDWVVGDVDGVVVVPEPDSTTTVAAGRSAVPRPRAGYFTALRAGRPRSSSWVWTSRSSRWGRSAEYRLRRRAADDPEEGDAGARRPTSGDAQWWV